MKPGPAISGGSHNSANLSRTASSPAISRGGLPSRFPSGIAQFAW
jgi:hypothetical protein